MCSIWTDGLGGWGGRCCADGRGPAHQEDVWDTRQLPESCWITSRSSCVSQISAPTQLVRLDGLQSSAFSQPVTRPMVGGREEWGGWVDQLAAFWHEEVQVYRVAKLATNHPNVEQSLSILRSDWLTPT